MIRVSVMYPSGEGKKLDDGYYVNVGHLYFNSVGEFQQAMKPHGKELFADVPNFTDIS